ncbi:MAG TPA: alpha/beta hydrolase [Nocardioides sp.]|nr:alpha/beta hydrolase [Nocardioides sp.]
MADPAGTGESFAVDTGEAVIAGSRFGSGPGVLLLHGFPETRLMWREVGSRLAASYSVVTADLRGYGDSSTPASTADHAPYSKRALAEDMARVMAHLGFDHFAVVGHDRGGRVAYRLALDHPEGVTSLAVLDVLPVDEVWRRADDRLMLGYWPWSLLAQPEPLPERLIAADPEALIDHALGPDWGTPASAFHDDARTAYASGLRDPARVHAICEEYRAAAGIDREHDAADRSAGRRVRCPVLVLWSADGPLDQWYSDDGGPLGIWREWADNVSGSAVPGGHFFPEADPAGTADRLASFLAATPSPG